MITPDEKPAAPDLGRDGAGSCPDREFVSCFLDGELASGTPEARHIGGCPRCGQALDAYAKIGCGLRQEMAAAVPDDLSRRLGEHVRRRLAEDPPAAPHRPFPLAWPVRIAAMVAVILLAGMALRGLLQERARVLAARSGVPSAMAPVIAAPEPAPEPPSLIPAPAAMAAVQPTPMAAAPGDVAAVDLAPAGLGAAPVRFVVGTEEARPAAIAAQVRHVWLSDSPSACCAKFAAAAAAIGIPGDQISVPDEASASSRQVVVKASRRQLVGLVRQWAGTGHRLISPAQPQPEQDVFSGQGDEPVQYAAVFVDAASRRP